MKKLLFFGVILGLPLSILGQGKVFFANDSLHLVYYDGGLYNGEAVYVPTFMPGSTLLVDLYMGTGSSSLSYVSTTTFSSIAPGRWNGASVVVNGIAGNTTVYTMIQVRDTGAPAEATLTPAQVAADPAVYAASLGFTYAGWSVEFQFLLGGSITYPTLYGPNSNWPPGTYPLDQYGPGSRGAIPIPIPEPAAAFLSLLGVAATMCARRKGFA